MEKEAEAMYKALGYARDYIRYLRDAESAANGGNSLSPAEKKLLREIKRRWEKSAKEAGITP